MTDRQKPAKRTSGNASQVFSAEERAAIQARAREVKVAGRRASKEDGESELLAKIAEMPPADRALAEGTCDRESQRPSPHFEDLVRHAGVCQGW
jgi:hypothetical protein